MKITVEIPDEEIRDAVKYTLVKNAVERIETDLWEESWGTSRYLRMYDKAITEGVRRLLKENIEDITQRATEAAVRSITSRGIKKLLDSVTDS